MFLLVCGVCVFLLLFCFFFFKQKTAYEMRISDWSSDVCSSDLRAATAGDVVALLGVFGQREERLEHTVGVVDQRLRDAVVADAGKTPLAVEIGRAYV